MHQRIVRLKSLIILCLLISSMVMIDVQISFPRQQTPGIWLACDVQFPQLSNQNRSPLNLRIFSSYIKSKYWKFANKVTISFTQQKI